MRITALLAVALLLSGCSAPVEQDGAATSLPSATLSQSQPGAEDSESEPAITETSETKEISAAETESVEPSESPTPASTAIPTRTPSSEPEQSEAADSESEPEPTVTPTQSSEPEPSASQPQVVSYTLAEVAKRNTASECWVAIDGGVYDLTKWIASHPGGASAIQQLCGTDGTDQFLGQHGGQARPSSTLNSYYLGPLQ